MPTRTDELSSLMTVFWAFFYTQFLTTWWFPNQNIYHFQFFKYNQYDVLWANTYGVMVMNNARCCSRRRQEKGGRRESQSHYPALKLLTVFWNIVSTGETFLLKRSPDDASYITIFLYPWTAESRKILHIHELSVNEKMFSKGWKETSPLLLFISNSGKLCASRICHDRTFT